MEIQIDSALCVGCGRCVKDCLPQALRLKDRKAHFLPDHNCMECGHCIAICPRGAVSVPDPEMREVVPIADLPHTLSADAFSGHMRARRSVRAFDPSPLPEEQVQILLDTGRFSPTGGNRQNVRYNVLRSRLPVFREMVLGELEKMWAEGADASWYPALWHDMYLSYQKDGKDRLFFDAGTVIAVSSDVPQAASIASAHMETMANALGLGVLYSGFTVRAVAHSEELQQFLKLKENYSVWTVLVIGKPRVSYLRTVPRRKADVIWD